MIKNEVDKFLREDVTQSPSKDGTSKQNNREIKAKAQAIADSYKGQIRDKLTKNPLNPENILREFKSSNGGYRKEAEERARKHTNNPSKEFQYNSR